MHCCWTPLRQFNEQFIVPRAFNLFRSISKGDNFAHFRQQVTIRAGVGQDYPSDVYPRGRNLGKRSFLWHFLQEGSTARNAVSYLSLSPLQTLRLITESGTWAKEMKLPDPLPPPRRERLEIHLFYPFLCFYLAREPLNASLCPMLHYQNFINAPFYTPLASAHLYYYYHYYCY